MTDSINIAVNDVEVQKKYSASLDEALTVAGVGWYNLKYCLVLSLFLIAPILEASGYGFVLPAAICDLNISDGQRGFIYSIPYIGIVLMSFQWGYLVDTKGRKKVLIYSSLGAGVFGSASGFMPDVISFVICKLLTALCIGCPFVVPYSYIAEILPKKYRDLALAVVTTIQILGSVLVPLLAWGILSLDFSVDFGAYLFRPWRLLVIVYAMLFVIASGLLAFGPESPRYLVAVGKNDEALKAVLAIFAGNTKKTPEDYPIKDLDESFDDRTKDTFFTSLKTQSLPLLKPPYLKWLLLNAFLLFGVYSVLSGLFAWIPDILNRLLLEDDEGQTACDAFDSLNQTFDGAGGGVCNDNLNRITFVISSIADFSSFVIAILIGSTVKFIDKKILLVLVFTTVGGLCIVINFVSEVVPFALLLPPIQSMSLTVGLVTAFSVDIFPVNLRGMAVCLTMTGAAMGSIFGSNISAFLLNAACEVTFYSFGGLLIFCGLLSMLLPNSKESLKN
ncbi:unnamed protein product [Arctia plantaginis]|uniref:Major facilitator superfamily (MFS) profile domain-containing protein n=1 Tax=Arctia plantaginis TaxID=874455 RepID=A0A8S0YUI4_ARCPL|nr:unnamed protein product [Arctia plantaginis]